jgi:hypothetical protein
MNKYKIKAVKSLSGAFYFQVIEKGNTTAFSNFAAAKESVWRRLKRERKETSAFSMLVALSINLLSMQELSLYKKLAITSCKGISPRQYGYLKGIYERQDREW